MSLGFFGKDNASSAAQTDALRKKLVEQEAEIALLKRRSERYRDLVEAADGFHTSPDESALWRRAVTFVRDRLGIERAAIYIGEGSFLRGTYGITIKGDIADYHAARLSRADTLKFVGERLERKDGRWIPAVGKYVTWDGEKLAVVGEGWVVATSIQSTRGRIGIVFNDCAISGAPIDEEKQDMLALFCRMLGNIVERNRVEESLRQSQGGISGLYEVASSRGLGFSQRILSFLALGCSRFGLETGILARLDGQALEVVEGVSLRGTIKRGERMLLSQTFCSETIASVEPIAIEHVAESRHRNTEAYSLRSVETYIGARVTVMGEVWGVLNFSNIEPVGHKFTKADREVLSLMAEWIGGEIERDAARTMLLESKASAEAAVQAKATFLASVSHEIRTPLNGILGMTSLILDTQLTDTQREYSESVRRSGEALLSLINDILDFSKLEASKVELDETDFSPRAVLEDAAEILAVTAAEKGIELTVLTDLDVPPRLIGDATRLRQILLNLGSNAVKFTHEGEVVIRARVEASGNENVHAVFSVRDTGIGMSPAQQDRLFKPFSQGDASTTRRYGGTGLGLAICRELTTLMGGTISVESEERRGSTFNVQIPFKLGADPGLTETRQASRSLRGFHMLVVDDNPANRRLLMEALRGWGVIPVEASGADEAMTILRTARTPFQTALIDREMPRIDGIELGRRICAELGSRRPALLLLSSIPGNEAAEAALLASCGFTAWLPKPVRRSRLLETLLQVSGLTHKFIPGQVRRQTGRRRISKAAAAAYKLLLVEDNAVNQRVAALMLEDAGYRCDIVANGRDAVKLYQTTRYDLILMDCQMPEMDGYEATAAIRAIENGERHIPIVALTAHAMQGDREKCLAAGMDDYMQKPMRREELVAALERWLEAKGAGSANSTGSEEFASQDHPVLDLERLRLTSGGDEGVQREIIALFMEDTRLRVAELAEASQRGETAALHREAHTIKGASATIGALRMQATAAVVEAAAAQGDLEAARAGVDAVCVSYRITRAHLGELLE